MVVVVVERIIINRGDGVEMMVVVVVEVIWGVIVDDRGWGDIVMRIINFVCDWKSGSYSLWI